ncbi:Arm DNA-binding domain-containing protein [Peribacillus sp. NPDC094092]|uniref:Arm DNA-binding domain-containing protein n=1 Tax=Peribacillus sp. NPDC094092 TaxID=3390611 RepID=UPI003CFDFB2C
MAKFYKYKKKGQQRFLGISNLLSGSHNKKDQRKIKKGFESKKEAQLAAEEMEGMIREGYEITPESLKTY